MANTYPAYRRRLAGRLANVKRRVVRRLGLSRSAPPVAVRVVAEDAVLAEVSLADLANRHAPASGVIGRLVEADFGVVGAIQPPLASRVGGADLPDWTSSEAPVLKAGVNVSRVSDVHYFPGFGGVVDREGRLFRSTIQEALYFTPTLGGLPNVQVTDESPCFAPPLDAPRLPAASVFVTWGGLFNYGHFLLDCLPALAAIQAAGLERALPPIAPPLNRWQRELVQVAFGKTQLITLDAPVVKIGEVAFSSCMDHFLHAPNAPLDRVRAGALSAAPNDGSRGRLLYISRSGDQKRRLVNEAELEAALAERGFVVAHPERMSVAEQVALFRDAEVVVAPTGAALANCLFMAPEAKLFELMPTNFTGVWVRGVCELFGIRWHGYFCPAPLGEHEVFVEGVRHTNVLFDWKIELPDFLKFLDDRL